MDDRPVCLKGLSAALPLPSPGQIKPDGGPGKRWNRNLGHVILILLRE